MSESRSYSADDVMEFFFGDEFLDMIALHLLNAFLQLDLKPLDFCLHLLPCHGANVRVEVDFGKFRWKIFFTSKIWKIFRPLCIRPWSFKTPVYMRLS